MNRKKMAECCTESGCAGEPFHNMSIAQWLFKVNVSWILVRDCPLFVTVEHDMPLQFIFFNVKRKMMVWPGAYLRPYKKNSE